MRIESSRRERRWQENRLFSVNLKALDTQVGSKTKKRCKMGLFRPEDIRSLQDNKSATNTALFLHFVKRF